MKYDHNQICTKNNEIEIGKEYCYKEEGEICNVIVLEDKSNDKYLSFVLKIKENLTEGFANIGHEFNVSAALGKYAYNGMWRLWDLGEYIKVKK